MWSTQRSDACPPSSVLKSTFYFYVTVVVIVITAVGVNVADVIIIPISVVFLYKEELDYFNKVKTLFLVFVTSDVKTSGYENHYLEYQ